MNKRTIAFELPENVSLKLPDKLGVIDVKPYFSLEDLYVLIGTYIASYFNGDEVDPIGAKYALMLHVIDNNTSIDIGDDKNPVNLDALIANGVWDDIQRAISNFWFLEEYTRVYVENIKAQKRYDLSSDKVIRLVAEKFQSLIDGIDSIDAEKVDAINQDIKDTLKQLENSPIANALSDKKRTKKG